MSNIADISDASLRLLGILKPFTYQRLVDILGEGWWDRGVVPLTKYPYYRKIRDDQCRLSKMDLQLTIRSIRHSQNRKYFDGCTTSAGRVLDHRFFELLYCMNLTRNDFSHPGEDCSESERDNAIDLMVEIGSYIDSNASSIIHTVSSNESKLSLPLNKVQEHSDIDNDSLNHNVILKKSILIEHVCETSIEPQTDHTDKFEWIKISNGLKSKFCCCNMGNYISDHSCKVDGKWIPLFNLESFEGIARISYLDGSYYEGTIRNGLRNGFGQMFNADGVSYQPGVYYKDAYIGKIITPSYDSKLIDGTTYDVIIESRKFRYEGQFRNGAINGKGTRIFKDGLVESGVFCNNAFLGEKVVLFEKSNQNLDLSMLSEYKGRLFIKKKGIDDTPTRTSDYSGYWKNGHIEGSGKYREEDNFEYRGMWHNNSPHGNGYVKFANGDEYKGHFVNGLFHDSNGVYSFKDGSFYSGSFSFGLWHGTGEYHFKNYILKGTWTNNLLNGDADVVDQSGTIVLHLSASMNKCIDALFSLNDDLKSILESLNISFNEQKHDIRKSNTKVENLKKTERKSNHHYNTIKPRRLVGFKPFAEQYIYWDDISEQ